jgi:hypothetical protein
LMYLMHLIIMHLIHLQYSHYHFDCDNMRTTTNNPIFTLLRNVRYYEVWD